MIMFRFYQHTTCVTCHIPSFDRQIDYSKSLISENSMKKSNLAINTVFVQKPAFDNVISSFVETREFSSIYVNVIYIQCGWCLTKPIFARRQETHIENWISANAFKTLPNMSLKYQTLWPVFVVDLQTKYTAITFILQLLLTQIVYQLPH